MLSGPSANADDRGILISRDLAARADLTKGAALGPFPIAGVLSAENGDFAVLDIAAAEKFLARYGKLDRIDVYLSPHQDSAPAERAIRAVLPPGYDVEKPGTRSEENQRMLRAFRWNLRVLSYIALVVGAFLIYNTISISVVRRRPEIGILRALGADRTMVFWLFFSEALLFGAIGSLAGVAIGRIMAEGLVSLIAQTVNSLYTSSRPAPIALGAHAFITAVVAGMAVAFLSALAPAREALRVAPTEAMGRGSREHQARLHVRRDLAIAMILSLIAIAASRAGPIGGQPVLGYISALLAVAAAGLLAPAVVLAILALARPVARGIFGAEGLLAGRSLAASLARTSVVVAALATAIAMMASVGIMVGSFRETVLVWLDTQLRADLYIRAAGPSGPGRYPPMDPQVAAVISRIPGVEALDVLHALEFRYEGQRATIGGSNTEILRRYGRLRFLPGEDRDAILRSLPHQDRAVISEPFANKHNLRTGSRLMIPLGARDVTLTVAGIYYDYSSERGFVILDRSTLLQYLPDQPPTNMAVYVARGADPAGVRRRIQAATARFPIAIAPNEALRRQSVIIFDRTFAITYALEAVAILVAMLGAANSLLALVLDRRRELGLLRYLGAAPRQIRRMILVEAGLLGLLSNVLGLALGFALSLLLVYVINKQSFGWTIQFHPPYIMLSLALALVWLITIIAAFYPARVASRLNPIEVIHEE
jgi:putative ABC transport system permease protein